MSKPETRPYIPQVPHFLQEKVIRYGKSNSTDRWSHFTIDELDLLSTQFYMFGSIFRERLHTSVLTRLRAKLNPQSFENQWLPEFQKYMPTVIKYDETNPMLDVSLDETSLAVNGSLIWSALTTVSEEIGAPIASVDWFENYPGLDSGMVIVGKDGKIHQGESVLAHEIRHCAARSKASKLPSYIVLDYDLVNGQITRSSDALAYGNVVNDQSHVGVCLAPRFPSAPDMETALEINPELAMKMLREKAAYNFLSDHNKQYVESVYKSDPTAVAELLKDVQYELRGMSYFRWADQSKIAWRKFPWEERIVHTHHSVRVPVSVCTTKRKQQP